jgi:hypothetical protein
MGKAVDAGDLRQVSSLRVRKEDEKRRRALRD